MFFSLLQQPADTKESGHRRLAGLLKDVTPNANANANANANDDAVGTSSNSENAVAKSGEAAEAGVVVTVIRDPIIRTLEQVCPVCMRVYHA